MAPESASRKSATTRTSRVTISDVALAIGITKGTVSRALNDHPDISDATRLRVKRTADRLGYRPLGSAQAIRTGRSRALGLVIETGEHDAHRPFLAEFLAGLSEGAASEGWTLTVATAKGGQDTLDTYRRLIDERKADGFVLPRTMLRDPRVDMLRALDIPFVLYGRTEDVTGLAWFDFDGHAAMEGAVATLVARGHHRIAYVGGAETHTYEQLRRQGYMAGLKSAGIAPDSALIARNAVSRSAGTRVATALLQLANPPSAFIFAIDVAALGLWPAARAAGLQVGEDLAVSGYDGTPEGAYSEPPLATYAVDTKYAGMRLAHLPIRQIRGEAPDTLREIAQATFLDRGSATRAKTRT